MVKYEHNIEQEVSAMPIPGNSRPTAESSMDMAQIRGLRSVTKESYLEELSARLMPSWAAAKDNMLNKVFGDFTSGLLDIIGGVREAVLPSWLPAAARNRATEIRDGQIALKDRTDLLSPLLDYISMSTPGSTYWPGTGRVPFTFQIGPHQGFTDMGDGRIRLDDIGVYDLRCMITTSWVVPASPQNVQVYLRVLKPDGGIHSVYSEQGYWITTAREITMTLISSVTVEEPGCFVDVYTIVIGTRGFWGGPKWSRLTVQHITRDVGNGTGGENSTDPDSGDTAPATDFTTASVEKIAAMRQLVETPPPTIATTIPTEED